MDQDIPKNQSQERSRAQIQKLEQYINYYKTQDWKKELRKAGFKREHVDRGEQLIQSFIDGLGDTILALQKRNRVPENFVIFPIKVMKGKKGESFAYNFDAKKKIIQFEIYTQNLQELAMLNPNSVFEISDADNPDKEVVNVGRAEDLCYLGGVEEMAHSIFFENHPEGLEKSEVSEEALSAYDADPAEYHSLGWRIRILLDAQKRGGRIPKEIAEMALKPLQERMKKAIEFRQKLKNELKN